MRFAFFVVMLFTIELFGLSHLTYAQTLTRRHPITVEASIPATRLTLFGYTSPHAKVELSGLNLEDKTQSDDTGYFIFEDIIIPKGSSDLCLSSLDRDSRQTNTVCIPPPPPTNYQTSIGPIIIPPTITIDKPHIKPGETIIASGQTVPKSPVRIYFFQQDTNAPIFPSAIVALAKLVPPVYAFSLPVLTVFSDADGNYSFNLPTAYSTRYRLFTSTLFQDQFNSPQSNTLTFNLPSLWFLLWQRYTFYIIMIPLFLVSLAVFLWLTIQYYLPASRPLQRYLPALYQKALIIRH